VHLTPSSWRKAWASEASDDSDGVDDVPLHLGAGSVPVPFGAKGGAGYYAPLVGGLGGGQSRPGTRGGIGGGSVVVGGGSGRILVNNGRAEGDRQLPSILAAGAAMAGDDDDNDDDDHDHDHDNDDDYDDDLYHGDACL
jgi:hypothetical protein